MKRKFLCLLLALTMVLGLAANVCATEPGVVDEGVNNGVIWKLTDDGNLYVERDCTASVGTAPWEKYKEQITKVTLGGGVYGTHFFNDMPNLTEVHFEKWPTRLEGSFKNCPKFTAFTSGEEYGNRSCRDGYILEYSDIIDRAPTGLSGTVCIPDYVKSIRGRAFWYCHQIEEFVLPEGFDSASSEAFFDCVNLKTVVFPSTTRSLGGDLFRGCTNLESIYFTGDAIEVVLGPNNLTPIFGQVDEHSDPADTRITANVYYPAGNPTWTEEVRAAFGGKVTWKAYDPELFLDVAVDEFYYDSVVWAVDNGITSGVNATHFAPNDSCLRSQVVTFLWRAAGKPVVEFENPFTDVKPTDYYYDAVLWAVSEGITQGVKADRFGPNEKCNRSQVVTFLWRAAGEPVVRAENPFADVKPTDYYYDAVLWAARNSITTGTNPTTFAPFEVCNRSQVVTFLYRADNIPQAETYTFELLTNDPSEETGFVEVEGSEFAAGESVIFYAEPWYGYLVEFAVQPEGLTPELYYLGGNYYELIMPECDVTLTAHFVPATGSYQYIKLNAANCLAMVNCLADEDGNDVAKPGEYVQILVIPDEGFSLADATFTAANGEMVDWWYLGSVEDGSDTIHVLEMVMPGSDVDITITCTPGTAPAAAEVRVPVSIG